MFLVVFEMGCLSVLVLDMSHVLLVCMCTLFVCIVRVFFVIDISDVLWCFTSIDSVVNSTTIGATTWPGTIEN